MDEILLENEISLENEEELNNLEYSGSEEKPLFASVRVTKKIFLYTSSIENIRNNN